MWAHYADRNRGVCLKFDLDLLGFRGLHKDMLYSDERQIFDFASKVIDESVWFFAKSTDWQEEQEIRYLVYPPKKKNAKKAQRNFRYPKDALIEIIFGLEWTFEQWHDEMHTLIDNNIYVKLAFMKQMIDQKTFEYKKADIDYKVTIPSN